MASKSRTWKIMLFAASILYLAIEIMFNAKLVEIASSAGFDANNDVLHQIELFGRAISGVGVSLLLLDALPAALVSTFLRKLTSITMVFTLVWPSVYFGQKKLIDTYLINPSSAEQRQQATVSVLLKQAMESNALGFDGIAFSGNPDKTVLKSPEDMTFLAIFGGLIYVDNSIVGRIKEHQDKIISNYVRARANTDFSDHIQSHRDLYKRLSETYSKEYAPASERYNKSIASYPQKQAEVWSSIETELAKGWHDYEAAKKSHFAMAEARSQEYGPQIFSHFQNFYKRCVNKKREVNERCATRENTNYKNMITKAGYGYIDKNYWLIEKEVSAGDNLLNTLGGALLTGGASLALQAIDKATGGDGGWKDKRYTYTNDAAHYRNRFLALPEAEKEFKAQTGYPSNVTDFNAFRNHPTTQQKIRSSVTKKGINLPSSWTMNDSASLNSAVKNKVKKDTDAAWNKEMKAKGFTMPPNLRWRDFEVHNDVQSRIKADMKENYVPGLRASWSDREFAKRVIEPAVARKVKEVEAKLDALTTDFADGGQYEQLGKNSLRTVIVPPISLFLSLFLICLTMLKLPIKLFSLFKDENTSGERVWWQKLGSGSLAIAPILIVLISPFYVGGNKYSTQDSSVNFFMTQVEERSVMAAFSLKWLLHAQPLMQPIGFSLAEKVQFMDRIEPISHVLEKLDQPIATPKP